ncbi:MAG: lysophospholipid acyltransferase family protein [Candidatus Azobacteroides sp.]|nr:lysophospholipid acyltransferase family protein [Candidatus Azobacteroides sp.]
MNRFLYALMYVPAFLLALLPFRILFLISDGFYFILYHIIRYRRKLVRQNLNNAFPEKTPTEIRKIEKDFYRHFCDCFVETIKLLHISDAQMKKRFVFKNMEAVQSVLDNRQSVVLLLGHYGNWEWITSINLYLKYDPNTVYGQVYRPLKNKTADLFFLNLRKRFHTVGFTKHNIYRDIVNIRRENKIWIIGFISDQKPSGNQVPHRMQFLNQETLVLTGTEKIARHTGAAVCYLDITCLKRGYYEIYADIIFDNAATTTEFEITEKYIHRLEQTILRNPSAYLWSHNRWRLKR